MRARGVVVPVLGIALALAATSACAFLDAGRSRPEGDAIVAVFQPDLAGVTLSPIADFAFLRNVSRLAPAARARAGVESRER